MGGQKPEGMKKHICTGLLAHVDAGKTTLSEAILYTTGTIRKLGRVDNKDAFLDTYQLERARGITIFSKQAEFTLGDTAVTLLDTPGHVDFSGRDGTDAAGAGLCGPGDQRGGRRPGPYGDPLASSEAVQDPDVPVRQ